MANKTILFGKILHYGEAYLEVIYNAEIDGLVQETAYRIKQESNGNYRQLLPPPLTMQILR